MDIQLFSDETLATKLKENPTAVLFSELFNRYQQKVILQCRQHVKDEETAKDLSQEVFLRLLTKTSTYNANYPFASWLRVIVHNRCVDHLQKNKSALHQEISEKIVDSFAGEVVAEEAQQPTAEILEVLMEKISGQDKMILLIKYKEHWSIRQISEALNISESAVKMRLCRSKEKLQKSLKICK